MKPIFLALLALASIALVGCDEETHPSKEVQESMNKQRAAMSPENVKGAAPGQAAPGTGK